MAEAGWSDGNSTMSTIKDASTHSSGHTDLPRECSIMKESFLAGADDSSSRQCQVSMRIPKDPIFGFGGAEVYELG